MFFEVISISKSLTDVIIDVTIMRYKVRCRTKIQRKTWCFIMDYLKVLVEEIHSVVVATVDETGHPHTAVIDMMWEDGKTVYF